MRYSLADYILEITLPNSIKAILGLSDDTISIGGEGSYLDSIGFSLNNNLWETQGDNTGSYIHIKNLDRTGTASLSMNMMSPKVIQLTTILSTYYNNDSDDDALTITLSNADSTLVITAESCYLTKLPDINLSNEPGNRTWNFTCGKIDIVQN